MGFVEDDDFIKCIQSFDACEHLFIRFGHAKGVDWTKSTYKLQNRYSS